MLRRSSGDAGEDVKARTTNYKAAGKVERRKSPDSFTLRWIGKAWAPPTNTHTHTVWHGPDLFQQTRSEQGTGEGVGGKQRGRQQNIFQGQKPALLKSTSVFDMENQYGANWHKHSDVCLTYLWIRLLPIPSNIFNRHISILNFLDELSPNEY